MHLNDEARLRMRPLFNPHHAQWQARREAMRVYYTAQDTLQQHTELHAALNHARERSIVASRLLSSARLELRFVQRRRLHWDAQPLHDKIRGAELAVCAAHDMLWVAQLAISLWDASYGPQAVGYAS